MRKKKDEKKREPLEGSISEVRGLNPETKQGILIILLFAIAAFLFLSFFHLAGTIGSSINDTVAFLFGKTRFLIPFIFVLLGTSLLFPKRIQISLWNIFGFLFFFVSFNTILNLLFLSSILSPTASELKQTGGFFGQLLGKSLPEMMGIWASLILLFALLLVSILLIFNTSLNQLLFIPRWFAKPFREYRFKKQTNTLYSSYDDQEEAVQEDVNKIIETKIDQKSPISFSNKPSDESPFHQTTMAQETKPEIEENESPIIVTRERRKVNLSFDLLEYRGSKPNSGDIGRNQEIIQRTLAQFGIQVEMGEISIGPTITQYTLRPAQGIKLAKIVALQNDLALALAAHPIRIEAPIPGKSLVGIEVPNQRIAIVALRELLETKTFRKRQTQTELVLGKDVSGKVWSVPLESMPHLLVAGATGSGKSVCLNTIILALLYQNGPDDLKFILIDPKRVELTVYAGIAHLLVPPITKVEDTINALKWTVREMERRLDVLSSFGVRDIASYNARVQEIMPRIVVVIDELADLMSASGHEAEATIVRIAQMARAVGIHLILATQRPSVDVITGTIKANFPSRIAFAVASQTDSRTILDSSGAEKLLGRGDMLYTSAEVSKPKRLQGAYVSEGEIHRIVQTLKQQEMPDYNYEITQKQTGPSVFSDDENEQDLLFDDAAKIVIQTARASTSLLQRRLKIGYSRAARIIDQLEEYSIIGPSDGARGHEVLINEWPPQSEIISEPEESLYEKDKESF
ncbi:cell division protein FtsK [Candidatus Uhrbacteria bacterium CG_4_9_14_3_um_filter_36_7]|uniref:Cell division protein FtsK n=1 Tax=Candidatus Uhrbacteria bacterium CG_4_9_14_3_um_filter_36_7 TaxID=1975033 RepID=A0A2M7XHB1_9BACT|nr:MAG: cell division protein FtsK [Candidatus Uhrbacteria bacterium CG_4_9_14_3_um_filter_36_7]